MEISLNFFFRLGQVALDGCISIYSKKNSKSHSAFKWESKSTEMTKRHAISNIKYIATKAKPGQPV